MLDAKMLCEVLQLSRSERGISVELDLNLNDPGECKKNLSLLKSEKIQ